MKTINILIHPFAPFTSQYLYKSIFSEKENILLESWPKVDSSLIDEKVETSFDLLKETVSVTSAARMKGKLKRRWPLNQLDLFKQRRKTSFRIIIRTCKVTNEYTKL